MIRPHTPAHRQRMEVGRQNGHYLEGPMPISYAAPVCRQDQFIDFGLRQEVSRLLLGVILSYSLVIQIFVAGIVGIRLGAVDYGLPGFELCSHTAPSEPADVPDHNGGDYCIFCFASLQSALAAPSLLPFHVARFVSDSSSGRADGGPPAQSAHYSVAQPRGPPLDA